jgi:hypothetical protein
MNEEVVTVARHDGPGAESPRASESSHKFRPRIVEPINVFRVAITSTYLNEEA